jgi:hypothetical protein
MERLVVADSDLLRLHLLSQPRSVVLLERYELAGHGIGDVVLASMRARHEGIEATLLP